MAADAKSKETRFNARLSDEQKALLQRAADLKGMSLSDFILGTAHDEALRVIATHDIIRLSRRDSISFLQAMENPSVAGNDVIQRFKMARKHRAK